MDKEKQFKSIISLIIVLILISILGEFFTFENKLVKMIFFLFYKISDIILLLYLYKFIKDHKKQKISLLPFVLIACALLFFMVVRLFPIPFDFESATMMDAYWHTLITSGIPGLVDVIGVFMLAWSLIKIKPNEYLDGSIRFVGISYFTMQIGTLIIIPLIFIFIELMWLPKISNLLYLLPLVAMAILYYKELKNIS